MNQAASLKPAIPLKQRLFFHFSHPWEPSLLFGVMAILLSWASLELAPRSWHVTLSLILLGMFCWTFVEYILHRFVFHWTQVEEPWRTLTSGLHMAHHRDTDVKSLIIAPPLVSIIFSGIIFLVLWGLCWDYTMALQMLAGLYVGYILYEWCHYGAHQFPPHTAVGRYLKQYHLRHHFKHPTGTFGVTSPLWDYVFHTTYKAKRSAV